MQGDAEGGQWQRRRIGEAPRAGGREVGGEDGGSRQGLEGGPHSLATIEGVGKIDLSRKC